jgi:hypothetical protein
MFLAKIDHYNNYITNVNLKIKPLNDSLKDWSFLKKTSYLPYYKIAKLALPKF